MKPIFVSFPNFILNFKIISSYKIFRFARIVHKFSLSTVCTIQIRDISNKKSKIRPNKTKSMIFLDIQANVTNIVRNLRKL